MVQTPPSRTISAAILAAARVWSEPPSPAKYTTRISTEVDAMG